MNRPAVVALGGGHGLSVTLRAARSYAGQVTAVVSVADDGGSSGRLRRAVDIDLPAPGDVRRCLVALADPDSLWARAFEYRFPETGTQPGGHNDGAAPERPSNHESLGGHALGNLILAGLADVGGDFVAAVDAAARILNAAGRVLPATAVPVVLKGRVDGREVLGQSRLGSAGGRIETLSFEPPDAPAPRGVVEAIEQADQVVLGPGSLFTSVLATCAVPDVRAALEARTMGRVYVCNLCPEPGETDGMSAGDHLQALRRHGVPVDVVVVDGTTSPPADIGARVIRADMRRPDGLAHDPARLATVLARLSGGEGIELEPGVAG